MTCTCCSVDVPLLAITLTFPDDGDAVGGYFCTSCLEAQLVEAIHPALVEAKLPLALYDEFEARAIAWLQKFALRYCDGVLACDAALQTLLVSKMRNALKTRG